MKKFKGILFLSLLATSLSSNAQTVEMADVMRSEGKIYVVVAIILIVLTGLIVYLFMIDKQVKDLENRLREKKNQTK